VNPQEPPSQIPIVTSAKTQEKVVKETTSKVDTSVSTLVGETVKEKTR